MGWIQDLVDPKARRWEEFYRNRWMHDQVVRSTHGVNCTGGCSWAVYVKDGIITWEMQQTDYPLLEKGIPPYEPRGCQRGISASWYVYSPIRVKYPYIRGPLLDFWRKAKAQNSNPVEAWGSIVQDDQKRKRYQRARGKGGFRRTSWDEVLELIAASTLYTAKQYGPDRIMGFAPIPAFSFASYASGARFLQLVGGVSMSFYDWYADLPNAFPEVWGDQTDVCESADWYNSTYIVSIAANLNMTRTPDVHFISEARTNGSKFVVISPDFNQVAKYSDMWIPVKAGQDTALWMAINHVILKEYHHDRTVPYFNQYVKQYTNAPFLVELEGDATNGYKPGQFLRANRISKYADVENGQWKMLMMDSESDAPKMPMGTAGFRWQKKKGQWNLKLEDGLDGSKIDPVLTFIDKRDDVVNVAYYEFASKKTMLRGVPVRYIETADGKVPVATVFDLYMAHYGVDRGLPGEYAHSYDDPIPYTPAWQEQYTGIGRETLIRFAREFATNAEYTNGRSMCITGASLNHWYSNGLAYRGPINAMLFTGCCGVNGGGMNHYVGQEKLAPAAPWGAISFALDWQKPPRQAQSPVWHYVMSDQWHYEGDFTEYAAVPPDAKYAKGHCMDIERDAYMRGWMPHYPQFDRNPLDVVREAQAAGAADDQAILNNVLEQIKSRKLPFSIEDPDAEQNWPRLWFIWRGNAIMASAKGHEFFLRHYLGTHDNAIAEERAKDYVKKVKFREPAPRGKFDLVIDINFRMDTSALYSDIVLPTAMWYEKNDLNTTDLHSFVHVLGAAVPPVWESKTDWDIFKVIAQKVSELAPLAFPEPVKDIVVTPLKHDTPDEISQPQVLNWIDGECEAIPGKTMPHMRVVERDYSQIYNKYIALGPDIRKDGMAFNGVHVPAQKFYDQLLQNPVTLSPDSRHMRCVQYNGQKYPSLEDALDVCNTILHLAPETNGDVSYDTFEHEEEVTGVPLKDLAEGIRSVRMTFGDITRQVKRLLMSPCWTGMVNEGRAYSAWCLNVERLVPWRTVTGRSELYLDHPWYIDFGENFATYKPKLDPHKTGDIVLSPVDDKALILNYITPHGKWHIHSTYYDNLRMLTLSRGMEPCWINDKDAQRIGIVDNQWVEVYNDNGVMVTRAAVSARVQPGTCMIYHAPDRTISMPKSQIRGGRRAGGHNSLTRTRMNPMQIAGGYGQFSYNFNYWGPIGIMTRDTHAVVRALEKLEW